MCGARRRYNTSDPIVHTHKHTHGFFFSSFYCCFQITISLPLTGICVDTIERYWPIISCSLAIKQVGSRSIRAKQTVFDLKRYIYSFGLPAFPKCSLPAKFVQRFFPANHRAIFGQSECTIANTGQRTKKKNSFYSLLFSENCACDCES